MMNSSEEEKSDEYLVVDSSNPWVLRFVYLSLGGKGLNVFGT